MSQCSLMFDGVKVSDGFMTGTISSKSIIENFDRSWIPLYQRDRVQSRAKIAGLVDIYKSGGKIDSIKLNLNGDYVAHRGEALIEGQFSIIDGQQRVLALIDSKVDNIKIPVELYLNIPYAEEVILFQQFNKLSTRLTFGELAKSAQGSYGVLAQNLIKRRRYPFDITVNASKTGMHLSLICPIFYMAHKKRVEEVDVRGFANGKHLLKFLETGYPDNHVAMTDFAVRQLFESFVDIFGEYDHRAKAYERTFFLAFCKVVMSNFLADSGKIDYRKFKDRIYAIPEKLLNKSIMRESAADNGYAGLINVAILITEFLNFKLKSGHLPMPKMKKDFASDEDFSAQGHL